jgi:two-component system, OmpR family, sensor kinase
VGLTAPPPRPRTIGERWLVEALLVAFCAASIVLMLTWEGWEALPFHFVYVSVSIVYGIRMWRWQRGVAAIGLVALSTGLATVLAVVRGSESAPELLEVPMMSLMFLAMVFHVNTRHQAAEEVARIADEQARLLERERQLFANASHELMTPLTVVRGELELLGRRGTPDPEELEQTRRIVLDEVRRGEALVADLLAIGRLDVGVTSPRRTVDAEAFLSALAERWTRSERRDWVLDLQARGTIALAADDVTRAVDNLLDNAVRHTPEGALVALRSWAEDGLMTIEVEDHGEGIPDDQLPRVFERFYHGGLTGGSQHGTGLGLSIVKQVVDAHGGDVQITSRAGLGTRVRIELPGLETGPAVGVERSAHLPSGAATGQ